MSILKIKQGVYVREFRFYAPASLMEVLTAAGAVHDHPCGGKGTCGKCAVELTGSVSEPNPVEQKAGTRLSCQAFLLGDACVRLPEPIALKQIELSCTLPEVIAPMEGTIGAAIDIGTTTLALKLCCMKTGRILAEAAMPNPQATVAADVMGRITQALQGKAELLRRQILDAVEALIHTACEQIGKQSCVADAFVITGNTTMLYLLTGRDTKCLSTAPFLAKDLLGCYEQISGRKMYLPECMGSFVGADITCAVLASGMCTKQETALLCDIGTNGELALWKDGKLYVTATAAGPAFEGAGIARGCGSKAGAIDRVWLQDGQVCIHTIGDLPAVGICGSGIIDAVAVLLQTGAMDETGVVDNEKLPLLNSVKLVPRDIQSVQLAKAAIAAGIATLLDEAGITEEDVSALYIAGGFGMHLNVHNAAAIGLIPHTLVHRAIPVGNAALSGALHILLNSTAADTAGKIARNAVAINLGGNPKFNAYYIDNMLFAESDGL